MSARKQQSSKAAIISTADDAVQSKLSAVDKGYYKDPYIPYFTSTSASTSTSIAGSSLHSTGGESSGLSLHEDVKDGYYQSIQRDNMSIGGGDDYLSFKNKMHQRRMMMINQQQNNNKMATLSSLSSSSMSRPQYNQPLIRRGTFARTCTIDHAISSFLSICHAQILEEDDEDEDDDDMPEDIQIVILGSGLDTSYLRAKAGLLHGSEESKNAFEDGIMDNVKWYEVDFEDVIQSKYTLLQNCPLFEFDCTSFTSSDEGGDNNSSEVSYAIQSKKIHTSIPRSSTRGVQSKNFLSSPPSSSPEQYHLVGFDLCQSFSRLLQRLQGNHSFQFDVPTLFVMECVQMYIPEQESKNILQTITSTLQHPFVALFDPIIQNDAFGKVMVQNLTKAKIISNSSMSLLQRTTLQSQIDKLSKSGFTFVTGCDFMTCYETIMNNHDRKQACMVEMLDEIEEWVLIMKHYCFVVASATSGNGGGGRSSRLARKYCEVGNNSCLRFQRGRCLTHGIDDGKILS